MNTIRSWTRGCPIPVPSQRDMLASLDARVFLDPWTLTIRCACGRERMASLPELARSGLRDLEQRTLGRLVRRLSCQDCGQRPVSMVAEHEPSREREELIG